MNPYKDKLLLSLMASLTLGLAPFLPEPHLIGKIRWIIGGAKGMQLMDYFDLLFHATPWMFLLYFGYRFLAFKEKIS